MRIFGKLFTRKQKWDDLVHDPAPEVSPPSAARDRFYEDLEAQGYQRAQQLILGDDDTGVDMSDPNSMVKKIMPRTIKDVKVVQKGDATPTPAAPDGMQVAEDAAPAGRIQGDGLTPAQENMIRNVDLYQTYARINPRILRHFVSRAFIGYPACTILGQHEVIGLCCSMPPEDAIASGFTLYCVSQNHKKDDNHLQAETSWLEELRDYAYDRDVEELSIKFGTYKRLYGIGIAIPRVELTDGHTFEEPYDPRFVKKGSFKGFTVIDPSRISWDFDAATLFDPLSEWYQKPEFLHLMTQSSEVEGLGPERRMHRSWCITSNYREVGEDLLATYMYGGQPLSQILYERVFCADTLANEIVALAMSKRTVVMEANLKEIVMQPKKIENLIKKLNYFRSNNSVFLKDIQQNGQVTQLETSLADLQPLSAQQYQYCAAFAGIPMTKLFKNVPSGLQATGQYEVEDYEQTIKPIRKDFKNLLNRWFELYIASESPERQDLCVRVKFNPFVTPKASEIQQIASQKSSMVCQLMMNNAITVTEARSILRQGEADDFNLLAPRTPEVLKKIEEMKDPEKQQQMQMAAQMAKNGGAPVGGAPTPNQPPVEPQMVTENKGVFAQALQEVLSKPTSPSSAESNPSSPVAPSAPAEAAGKVPSDASPSGVFSNALKSLEPDSAQA